METTEGSKLEVSATRDYFIQSDQSHDGNFIIVPIEIDCVQKDAMYEFDGQMWVQSEVEVTTFVYLEMAIGGAQEFKTVINWKPMSNATKFAPSAPGVCPSGADACFPWRYACERLAAMHG